MNRTSGAPEISDVSIKRAEDFVSSLQDATDTSSREAGYARAGMAMMVIGLALAVVATVMSQMSDNPLDQSTQISLGIAGLAAVCFGGAIFLRYGLGQLLSERHTQVSGERVVSEQVSGRQVSGEQVSGHQVPGDRQGQ